MSGFLLPAALLVLLAVAFAVSALWQRSRRLAIAIAIALPLAAAGLYAWRGTPAALDAPPPAAVADTGAPAPSATGAPPEVEALVADLEAKLAADPDQWEGWALLGQVRLQQERFPEARDAFARAHSLVPDNDVVAVSYAEALLRASEDRRFPPEAVALIERAARADPPEQRAVFFLGMHRMLEGNPGEAADLWESLLPRLDEAARASLMPQIAAARAAAAQGATAPAGGAAADTGPRLVVTVDLDAAMKARIAPGAVLYVFARPESGGPPVAVERVVPGAWPVQVTLSDADRPMPTAALSAHAFVEVTARLAQGGDATPRAGDIEAAPVRASTAKAPMVVLRLDRVRP